MKKNSKITQTLDSVVIILVTKNHLQASRVACHLANHDADITTYVTMQHKVCSHHSVKKDYVLISHSTTMPCVVSSRTYYQSKDQNDFVQKLLHEIIIWYNTDDINDMCLSFIALFHVLLQLLQKFSRIPCNCNLQTTLVFENHLVSNAHSSQTKV